jgi:Cation transport ATPase
VQGDPTEGALIVAARKFGVTEDELARFPRIAEIPFTSERKRHTTVHLDRENPAELRVFVKGAPDILLAKTCHLWDDGKIVPLSEDRRAELSRRNDALAGQALRTLAIATAPCRPQLWDLARVPTQRRRSSCPRASRMTLCCSAWSA